MMGATHSLSGAAVFLAAAPVIGLVTELGPVELLAGSVITAGAAMLCDFDHPSSTIARTFGLPTQILSMLVARWAGGHRKATHSLLFALGAGAVAGVLSLFQVGQIVAVTLALGLGARALGWTKSGAVANVGTFAGCALLAYVTAGAVNLAWLPAAYALGCLAHIAGDACTVGGVPVLWPSRRCYRVARLRTGGWVETRLVGSFLLCTIGALTWVQVATQAGASHLFSR